MRSRRRRDRMKDDPVVDYNDAKSAMDEALMSYESGETVTTGGMFPTVGGGLSKFTTKSPDIQADTSSESYFGDMRRKAAPAPTKAAPAPTKTPTLKRGTFNNDDVRALQSSLKDIASFAEDSSIDPGSVDADFGGNTEMAVKAFQKRYGIEDTGVVDSITMDRIREVQTGFRDNPISADRNLAEMRTAGAPMTPAQELRLTRPAAAKTAPDQFDMREDFLEAQAAGRADALEQTRKAEDLRKRIEEKVGREDMLTFLEALGVVEST